MKLTCNFVKVSSLADVFRENGFLYIEQNQEFVRIQSVSGVVTDDYEIMVTFVNGTRRMFHSYSFVRVWNDDDDIPF